MVTYNGTDQNLPVATYSSLQEGHVFNSSCFSVIHNSKLRSDITSEIILLKKNKLALNTQDGSTKFNNLG